MQPLQTVNDVKIIRIAIWDHPGMMLALEERLIPYILREIADSMNSTHQSQALSLLDCLFEMIFLHELILLLARFGKHCNWQVCS